MAKQPKAKVKQVRNTKNFRLKLFLIPLTAFLIKMIWIATTKDHGMLGADGENYLKAVEGIWKDGIFSTETNLHYWPAGYSIFLVICSLVNKTAILPLTAIIQSLIYLFGCAYFVDQLRGTRIVKFAYPVAFILAFNPTLSLSSMAIGYETPTAALLLLGLGLMIQSFKKNSEKGISKELVLAGLSFTFAAFMQPRLVIVGIVIFIVWGLATQGRKTLPLFLVVSVLITFAGPALMILRNEKAMGFFAISTNLGTTMRIGAGTGASGGYANKVEHPVPCSTIEGNAAQQDSHLTKCVISWYLSNPKESFGLSIRKAVYFWSPWFGPIANGTNARNPWLQIEPFKETIKTQSGFNMVYGNTGKLVSWAWLLGQLFFMFFGFRFLWRVNGLERLIGLGALLPVLLSWMTSLGTIGDHRFRIPTMGLSLFLQVIGFFSLFGGKSRLTGSVNPLRWKSLERKANLLP